MKRFVLAVMLSITTDVAAAQDAKFVAALKLPGTLDSLAQEMWMKVIGSKACKIEKDLPKSDMDTIFRVMNAVDAEGVSELAASIASHGLRRASPAWAAAAWEVWTDAPSAVHLTTGCLGQVRLSIGVQSRPRSARNSAKPSGATLRCAPPA